MKKNKLAMIALVVFFISAFYVFLNKTNLRSGNNNIKDVFLNSEKTAKSTYPLALTEARKRKNDSQLVGINAYVNNKGVSDKWYVEFYSPSSQEYFKISVKNGKIADTINLKTTKKESIGEDWTDSDKIAERAIKECGKTTDNKYFISLDHNAANIKWRFNCKVGENRTLVVEIDGPTGEFLSTKKLGIGW